MNLIRNLNKTAVICDDEHISYTQLLRKIACYTSLLNIEKGDRVSIYSENRTEYFYSFFSIWNKKGVVNPIDFNNTSDEISYVLKDCTPKYIFTSLEGEENIRMAVRKSGLNIEVFVFEELSFPKEKELVMEMKAPDKEDLAVILYTSGTTGQPKGVMLTFDNFLFQIESISKYRIYEQEDRVLTLLPLHHVFPLVVSMIMSVFYGATTVLLTELTSERIKQAMIEHKITMFIGVPKLYEVFHKGIMKKINSSKITKAIFNVSKNISSEMLRKFIFKKVHDAFGGHMKYLISGGAKLDEEIARDFATLGFKVLEGYGMTETAPIITFTKPDNIKAGSAGSPLEGLETKITEDGELLVRGRSVMKGYYNKPEQTEEVLDTDGWLHTGDLVSFDEDNYITITGRKKEMIVLSNGKNVDPMSVEQEIMNISKGFIQEIAVIDYHNHLNALVLPDYEHIDSQEIGEIKKLIKQNVMDNYNNHSLSYKKVINFKIVSEELPKTRLGKLKRFMLRDLIA